jgi:hypothetical protein
MPQSVATRRAQFENKMKGNNVTVSNRPAAITCTAGSHRMMHRAPAGPFASWPSTPAMDDAALHAMLYQRVVPLSRAPWPDFAYLQDLSLILRT